MNDTGGIVLKKYSPLSELNDFAKEAVESIFYVRRASYITLRQG